MKPSFRDVEFLSAYLDEALKPSDAARLQARLDSDPDLRAVMDDLRAARGLLRQLPSRRAPRRFTLTPQMAGVKPPLPRAYPALRFATALATILLLFTFTVNTLSPAFRAAPAPVAYGMGGGGGGGPEEGAASSEAATEAPAAPSTELLPQATMEAADSTRMAVAETPTPEAPPTFKGPAPFATPEPSAPPIAASWEIGLLILAIALAGGTWLVRFLNDRKWRGKVR